jgi:tetratricopeptide (TPR) repeat protein
MTTDLLAWDEDDQTPDPDAEYRMLLNGLRRTEGFGLFFVQCSPFGGKQIIQRVRDDLATQPVEVLTLEEPLADGNVFKCIKHFLDDHAGTQILFVQGLELSLLDYEESKKRLGWSSEKIFSYSWHGVPPVLINLNQQRERFRDSFATRIVFLLPVFAVKYLVHRAPDFFDWRSGVAQIADDTATLSRESLRLKSEGGYSQYLSWPQEQRNRRILEIQSLLEAESLDDSERANLYLEQGNLFVASTEWEAAIATFDAEIAIKPDDHKALIKKGIALGHELGCYKEAIASFDAAIAIQPNDPDALYFKGIALRKLSRYEEAVAAFDAAIAIQPVNPDALIRKGIVLGDLGHYEEAISAYDAAIAIKPDYHEALYNKGVALTNLGRYEETIAAYDAAIAINPDAPDPFYNKACASALQGAIESALENLERTIYLSPEKYREMAKTDTDFDLIRADPRFQALLER